jgi:hypothetical protein
MSNKRSDYWGELKWHPAFKLAVFVWVALGVFSIFIPFFPKTSERFYALTFLPKIGWYWWAIGLLAIAAGGFFEGGFRVRSRYAEQLERSLANPTGPTISILNDEPNRLSLAVDSGTAYDVTVHAFTNGHLVCLERKISHITVGSPYWYSLDVESTSGIAYAAGRRFEIFLTSVDLAKPVGEKTLQAIIPMRVTYWDGGEKDFDCSYELHYNFITKQIRFTLKNKKATLRPRPKP